MFKHWQLILKNKLTKQHLGPQNLSAGLRSDSLAS